MTAILSTGDIQRLNRQYLLLARELARDDPDHAQVLLGLSSQTLQSLAATPLTSLEQAADQPGVLLFRGRFDNAFWRILTEVAAGGDASRLLNFASLATLRAAAEVNLWPHSRAFDG